MKHPLHQILAVALLMSCVSLASAAQPVTGTSNNSAFIQPGNGSIQCSTYNSPIQQVSTLYPRPNGTLFSRDGSEAVPYSYTGTALGFNGATRPVNFAVLTNGNGQYAQIIYPTGGVTADSNMAFSVNGQIQTITAFSLCYGLPFVSQSSVPRCEDLSTLNGTAIQCPTDGTRRVIFSTTIDQQGYGTNQGPVACVCNSQTPLSECDPKASAGQPNACPDPAASTSPQQVNGLIQLSNDPYYCFTLGGTLKCYAY